MVAVLFVPVGVSASWVAYAGVCGLMLGAWLAGLGVGFMVHLGAVWAAYSPALAGLLDAVRGQNPRMQAALIYAPGVALLLVGLSVEFGAIGLEAALLGWTPGWLWLVIPVTVGGICWTLVGSLSERFYVRASLLLAEVEGAWGQHDEEEQAGSVYFQRLASGRPHLLRALRNGWRSQRLYATGGWLLGVLIAAMSWSDLDFGLMWGAGAVVLVAAVGARMAESDPVWLDQALGVSLVSVGMARAVVSALYTLGVWAPVGCVFWLRHGVSGLHALLGLMCLAVLVAGLAASSAAIWHRRGIWAYGASGIVGWAGFVSVMG